MPAAVAVNRRERPRPDARRSALVDEGVEVKRPHAAPAQFVLVKKRQQHRRHQRYSWSARIDIAHLAGLDVRPQTRLDRRKGLFERMPAPAILGARFRSGLTANIVITP